MRILAMDSSGLVASVAIVEENQILAEYTLHHKKTHSQTLLPMIESVCQLAECEIQTIDAIAVAAGPGSFTGLRIGSATAKGLGFALNKPLIAVPTLEGLAYNLYQTPGLICPMMDARREQVYTGVYAFTGAKLHVRKEQTALSVEKLAKELLEQEEHVTFLGDGAVAYREMLLEQMKGEANISFAPPHLCLQRGAAVGMCAVQYYRQGKLQEAGEHKPEYIRMAQAERVRLEKKK